MHPLGIPRPGGRRVPLWGIGITSFVLGTIGLLLFAMPVLGAPVSAAGLFLSILGLFTAGRVYPASLRWSSAGVGLGILSLGINVWLYYAPGRFEGRWKVPEMRSVPHRPFVAPPSRSFGEG